MPLPYLDFKPKIAKILRERWQSQWDTRTSNKLHGIKPKLGPPAKTFLSRRDECVLTRVRIGHTHLTHSFLLKGEPQPQCSTCHVPLTVAHFMVDCSVHTAARVKYLQGNTLDEVLTNTAPKQTILYLKEIGLFDRL
jgi:hypothetical protein